MRTSLFYALNGALGVVAHESLAYFKIDSGKEEYHRSLDGCGKHGKHKWVPDPSTFVFPQHDYKPGNSWDLCVDSAHCAPHEALSKVYFDFKDNAIVFDFKHIEHYKYEDVVVYIERGKPPGEHSQKYSKESDHCVILHDYKQAKCQIPYFSLTDGGSYDELCPIKDNGGWRLYIKIKAKISHGYKKYGLYSRAGDIHEKYFTLSYTCAECKDYKHESKYELLEEGHEKEKKYDGYNDEKKYDGYKDEKKYDEYKDEKKYDEYKYEEEKKYNENKYEKGDKKYKRGIKDYDGEKYDHDYHKHHHKYHDHGHHGYDHDEHHYDHHNKHHDEGYDHEHKYKHHDPYKHEHGKNYEHGHYDNEYKHYDHGHHHGHHGDYKHHEHYDPSRHHDFNAFLNSYFDKYGHHDYNNGKHHYKHHDGYNHHHARGLDAEKTKNGEKSEKLEQKSEDENKHKHKHKHHHHHGHHHDHKHDHLHKHRHSHYDYHHYEHYDPGYYYHHEYKHHDHKNHGHNDYNNYDHKNYDHKGYDHKHHDHKDYDNKDYDNKDYGHKDYDHKHHDHKDYGHKDYDNKDYGNHHDHHKHYEHHDPSYHHENHKYHDYKHGDKYDHHHHSKRSSYQYQHHGKHYEEPPVTVYYKEKAEDVNAQANHVIYEKEQKHEIPAHICKKLAEASKKHHYDHEKKHAYEHNHKHIHEDQKHAEENYHQMKLAEAKLSQAIEEYYAIRYGKQHNEAHGHKKHEYHQKEHKPAHEHHYGHYEHKPEHHQHHGHYEHKPEYHQHQVHYEHKPEHKPEHKHHFGHYAKVIEPEHKHHYGHHEHKPEKGYYEKKEFEHKKENEHNKYSHAVYEQNKYEPEKHHYQHYEHKEYEPSKYHHAHHEPSYYHDKKESHKHYNHEDGNVHVAFEKLWKEKASHQQKQNEKYAAVHYEQHPYKYGHYSKRSALAGHGDEVAEIDTAKVDKYIAKAEYNINDGTSKAIYKAIKSAGEDPTTGTIIKFYKKVEKAIKYIVFKNLKKAVDHITHVDGIREPESHEVDKKIYKAIKHILEAAGEIFTKTIDALGENPTEKEVEYAVAKVEKLLTRVVDKYVREAIIEIFDLEYITENSYGYYEKHEKYEKRQVQNATESAVNATATVANSTVEAASKKEDQAANRFMRLFMRQDSQNATAVNATADAANATETQTLMRFMRRQETSVKNATEASINATAQAVADVAEAVNATVEAANVTETQTLMRFMRRQDQNATDSAANTTTQAVADVEQALNTTSGTANTTESQHSKRVTVHVYPDGTMVVGQPKIFQWEGAYHPIKFVGKKNGKRDGAKFYNGYVPKCKGNIVKAYGLDGHHSGPTKEFAQHTHPGTCYKHHGEYVRYGYKELRNTVYGKLYESNGGDKKFGNYFIELAKGRDSYAEEIVVSVDIHDKYQYEVSEAKVYVGCGPGEDDHYGSNICSEKTYPYVSVAEKGLNEFVFAFPDAHRCHEYFFVIVVDFCDNKYSS